MSREPILWMSTGVQNYRGRVRPIVKDGRAVFEKGVRLEERLPQIGHDGAIGYDKPRYAQLERYVTIVRHDGHVVAQPLTNAAAQANADEGSYKKHQIAKQRYFGWFPLGRCPVAMLLTDELADHQIIDRSLIDATPCNAKSCTESNPCAHAITERDARRKQHVEMEREKLAPYQDQANKLVADVASAVGAAVANAMPGKAKGRTE